MKTMQELRDDVEHAQSETWRLCFIWMHKKKVSDSARLEQRAAKRKYDAAMDILFKSEDELYARINEGESK